MPALNYSKFDKIVDSDDEEASRPAQKDSQARSDTAAEIRQRLQTLQNQRAEAQDKTESTPAEPETRGDRFAYADEDIDKPVQESLKQCLSSAGGLRVGDGMLSVAKVEKVDGEAMKLLVRGETRFVWDLTFVIQFAYKWTSSSFDQGMQRAQGTITVSEFSDATTLRDGKSPPVRKARWAELAGLDKERRKAVEDSLGHRVWPPPADSLMHRVTGCLSTWSEKLPQVMKAIKSQSKDGESVGDEKAVEPDSEA
mmetsp:Transcript_8375/g.18783  ORF Transcript_8375/g.18783 Transcript_8375/m.18783 type:complete len:254 (+) Transcript_8375:101-862(+)